MLSKRALANSVG